MGEGGSVLCHPSREQNRQFICDDRPYRNAVLQQKMASGVYLVLVLLKFPLTFSVFLSCSLQKLRFLAAESEGALQWLSVPNATFNSLLRYFFSLDWSSVFSGSLTNTVTQHLPLPHRVHCIGHAFCCVKLRLMSQYCQVCFSEFFLPSEHIPSMPAFWLCRKAKRKQLHFQLSRVFRFPLSI